MEQGVFIINSNIEFVRRYLCRWYRTENLSIVRRFIKHYFLSLHVVN